MCFFSLLKHIVIIIGIRRRNNLPPPFNAQWVKYRCVEGGRFGKLSKRKHKEGEMYRLDHASQIRMFILREEDRKRA